MRRGQLWFGLAAAAAALVGAGSAQASTPFEACGGVMATIVGTDGPDHITGTPSRDSIWAGGGDDYVNGGGGGDHICGAGGDDLLVGGITRDAEDGGSDDIRGGGGSDTIRLTTGGNGEGEGGDDVLFGPGRLSGGDGDDELYGRSEAVVGSCGGEYACFDLSGGRGNDLIDGGDGTSIVGIWFLSGAKSLRIDLAKGVSRGEGRDTLRSIDAVTITENSDFPPAGDRVRGNEQANILDAGSGADTVRGRGGADLLKETIFDFHPDRLYGGAGDDRVLDYEDGADTLVGGPGADFLSFYGTSSAPALIGGAGADRLEAYGNYLVDPPLDTAHFAGGPGADELISVFFRSELLGGAGPDYLQASPEDDVLYGDRGQDVGSGGEGFDRCTSLEDPRECEGVTPP